MVKQLSLDFGRKEQRMAGALASVLPQVRAAMNRVASEHPRLSRDLIADQLSGVSKMAGVKLVRGNAKGVKTASVDKWLNPTDSEHPPSIAALVAFCLVTESAEPLEPLLAALGCEVMTEDDKRLRDYARAILAEREARKAKKQLEANL